MLIGPGLMLEVCSLTVQELFMKLMSVLMYGSETMKGKKKERSGMKVIQMYSLRVLLGIRRMGKVLNTPIRE